MTRPSVLLELPHAPLPPPHLLQHCAPADTHPTPTTMSLTGIKVGPGVSDAFDALKLKRKSMALEMKIVGDQIVVEKEFPPGTKFSEFVAAIPKDEPRYYLVDFPVTTDEGIEKSKLVYILWNPDSGKRKEKMIYAASDDTLKSKLAGGVTAIGAFDLSDLDEEDILKKVR